MKRVTVLGSTGSIGTQALEVVASLGFAVTALTAQGNAALLEKQIRRFAPRYAALKDEAAARDLRVRAADTPTKVLSGAQGIAFCAAQESDCVLNSIVGIAGLRPTLAALEAGIPLALANKESLVAGGALVTRLAAEKKVPILPVDSEHSAIFQCLQGCPSLSSLRRVILTASGGAFFGKTRKELERATLADALRHPSWSMGAKITVDSATMMNKGLEVMEAAWLFGLPPERIEVLIHRQSVVHSMVEYADHSVVAQLGVPDMRIPIQYALTYPERLPSACVPRLKLEEWGTLSFEAPDTDVFPAIPLARAALACGGLAGAVLNGANEAANALFREGKLRFLEIIERVALAMERLPQGGDPFLPEDIFGADQAAREFIYSTGKG